MIIVSRKLSKPPVMMAIIIPIIQVSKLGLRRVMSPDHAHTVSECQSQDQAQDPLGFFSFSHDGFLPESRVSF